MYKAQILNCEKAAATPENKFIRIIITFFCIMISAGTTWRCCEICYLTNLENGFQNTNINLLICCKNLVEAWKLLVFDLFAFSPSMFWMASNSKACLLQPVLWKRSLWTGLLYQPVIYYILELDVLLDMYCTFKTTPEVKLQIFIAFALFDTKKRSQLFWSWSLILTKTFHSNMFCIFPIIF